MKLYLFVGKDRLPGDHGELGPKHAHTVEVDSPTAIELMSDKIGADNKSVVRLLAEDGREWLREGDVFVEVKSGG